MISAPLQSSFSFKKIRLRIAVIGLAFFWDSC